MIFSLTVLGPPSDSKDLKFDIYFNKLLDIGNGGQVIILYDRQQHLNNCLNTSHLPKQNGDRMNCEFHIDLRPALTGCYPS